jgi:hypothetical protein
MGYKFKESRLRQDIFYNPDLTEKVETNLGMALIYLEKALRETLVGTQLNAAVANSIDAVHGATEYIQDEATVAENVTGE